MNSADAMAPIPREKKVNVGATRPETSTPKPKRKRNMGVSENVVYP